LVSLTELEWEAILGEHFERVKNEIKMKKCLTIATTLAAVATMATGAKWDNVKTPPPTLTELLGLDSSKESETVTPTDTTQSPDSAPTHQTPKHWRKRAAAAAALEKPEQK
jgi:hypothetical protein